MTYGELERAYQSVGIGKYPPAVMAASGATILDVLRPDDPRRDTIVPNRMYFLSKFGLTAIEE